jgi:hypothetical protein
MPKPSRLSKEAFDRLLQWLGPDAEEAGMKYQETHRKLVRLFGFKGCDCPEDLADEVIDRVAQKLLSGELPPKRSEDVTTVFYGLVKFVHFEHLKESSRDKFMTPIAVPEEIDVEKQHRCLDRCKGRLDENDRNFLLDYYRYVPGQKIQHRKSIAEQMRLAPNALRIRACRLRSAIKECVVRCVQSGNSAWVQ